MHIQKVSIDSDLRHDGQIYQASDEVRQKITIQRDGKVSLHALSYEGLPCWEEEKEIEVEKAEMLLDLLEEYIQQPTPSWKESCARWSMCVVFEDGSTQTYEGAMTGQVVVEEKDLTQTIRQTLPFASLAVFDLTESL